jgi:ATP-dependent DNA helicase RecG
VTFTRTKKFTKRVGEKGGKKVGKKVGEKLGVKLGENEIKILELMEDNKYITTKELSEHIKISTTGVDNNILKLKKKGVIKRIGPAKGGYWKVIKK